MDASLIPYRDDPNLSVLESVADCRYESADLRYLSSAPLGVCGRVYVRVNKDGLQWHLQK